MLSDRAALEPQQRQHLVVDVHGAFELAGPLERAVPSCVPTAAVLHRAFARCMSCTMAFTAANSPTR